MKLNVNRSAVLSTSTDILFEGSHRARILFPKKRHKNKSLQIFFYSNTGHY
jgi:hypothetical protein